MNVVISAFPGCPRECGCDCPQEVEASRKDSPTRKFCVLHRSPLWMHFSASEIALQVLCSYRGVMHVQRQVRRGFEEGFGN